MLSNDNIGTIFNQVVTVVICEARCLVHVFVLFMMFCARRNNSQLLVVAALDVVVIAAQTKAKITMPNFVHILQLNRTFIITSVR